METNHFLYYIHTHIYIYKIFFDGKTILFLDTFSPHLPLLSGMAHSEV